MTSEQFLHLYNLKTGDRLIVNKSLLIRHHAIFIQGANSEALVAENRPSRGVHYTPLTSFIGRAGNNPIVVEKFTGTEKERAAVISRINSLHGTDYNLVNFNCEHMANVAQGKENVSAQVGKFALGVALALILLLNDN